MFVELLRGCLNLLVGIGGVTVNLPGRGDRLAFLHHPTAPSTHILAFGGRMSFPSGTQGQHEVVHTAFLGVTGLGGGGGFDFMGGLGQTGGVNGGTWGHFPLPFAVIQGTFGTYVAAIGAVFHEVGTEAA